MNTTPVHVGTRQATLYFIMATLGFSLLPLALGLSNSKSNPALSAILISIGTIIVMSVLLRTIIKREKVNLVDLFSFLKKEWKKTSDSTITKRLWNKYALLFITAGGFSWLFFTWSLNYLDVAVASIIGQIQVVGVVLLYNFKWGKKILGLSPSISVLFIWALFGVIYISLSHNSINSSINIKGLILITVFIVLSSIWQERSLYWAREMYWATIKRGERYWATKKGRETGLHEPLFFLVGLIIANIFFIILVTMGKIILMSQGIAWSLTFTANQISWFSNETSWLICIAVGFVSGIGIWWLRKGGSLRTQTLNIVGIYYLLTPFLSVIWLIPFGMAQLEQWDYFIIGALIITATSTLIAIEGRTERKGFRGLIVSLWSVGVLTYFREEWIQWPWLADNTPWEWGVGSVDYYSIIVVSATIFILILSFRISRLVERTNKEEDQYLRMKILVTRMMEISKKPQTVGILTPLLEELDQSSKPSTIGNLRHQFNYLFKKLRNNNDDKDFKKFAHELELDVRLLCKSKERGRYLAENLVLYIFALVTIMVTMGTRPAVTFHWNALLIDILAFLFSAGICFMTINLVDLRLYRERPTDEPEGDDSINRTAGQVIYIILALVVSISFVVLLYDKWMGIWFI